MLSLIIPTLNAAESLDATLASLAEGSSVIAEIVISDGESRDATLDVARRHGCKIVTGERGRGSQLCLGARTAQSAWLLFLHADTRLSPGWAAQVERFIASSGADAGAAVFTLAMDDDGMAARILERIVALRIRLFGLPYGDQGLLIARRLYDAVGGFAPIPLMEDVDLVRRIGRRRLQVLPARALTSAARYRRAGYLPRMMRNAFCLALYFAGVPPRRIARLYG